MKKVKIEIPKNTDIPEGKSSTYFKIDTTKIKRIPEKDNTEVIHDHIFVGENEFINFLKNPINIPGAMKIISIENTGAYSNITIPIPKISKSSGISTIIQD